MRFTAEEIKLVITQAFADVPQPAADEIAKCSRSECDECAGIRWGFRGVTHDLLAIMPYVLEYHAASLPLLLPPAFHYLISDYMCYSVDHPDCHVSSYTRMGLGEDHQDPIDLERFRMFSENQRRVVIVFFEFLKTQEIEGDEKDNALNREKIESSIKVWQSML